MTMCRNFIAIRTPFVLFFVLSIVAAGMLDAQIQSQQIPFQPTDSGTEVNVQFSRMLNTFQWSGVVRGLYTYDDWSLGVFQQGTSQLFRSTTQSLQDNYAGTFDIQKKVSEWLSLSLRDTSHVSRSTPSLDVGALSLHRLLAGATLSLPSGWSLGFQSGYERNTQASIFDDGVAVASWLSNPLLQLDEFSTMFRARFEYSNLQRRKPYDGGITFTLRRDFTSDVVDSLSLFYQAQKREFYTGSDPLFFSLFGVSTNILSRNVNVFQCANTFLFRSGNDFLWSIQAFYSQRTIVRKYTYKIFSNPQTATPLDTKINELQLMAGTSLEWNITSWWSGRGLFQYTEREESHAILEEEQTPLAILDKQRADASRLENLSRRSMVSVSTAVVLTAKDSITLETSLSILRYDTPDTTNYNDRDELWVNIGLEYFHWFSSVLGAGIRSDLSLDHLVYLSRRQSANNNWNRVLRLECKSIYQPSKIFRTLLRAEVLANYTVSDYEQYADFVKSYAFRQFRLWDSTVVWCTKRLGFVFESSLRFYERGILNWKEFRERPEQYFGEYTAVPACVYISENGSKIQLGYRLFLQKQYKYEGRTKQLEQVLRSAGPTVLCQLSASFCNLSIDGWYERRSIDGRTTAVIPNLAITTSYVL